MFITNTKAKTELVKYQERVETQITRFATNINALDCTGNASERRAIVLDMATQLESINLNVGWMVDELFRINE